MSKKLMLLAAGVLAGLAFTALPSVASAGEWTCETETGAVCGTFSGSNSTVTILTQHEGGSTITCTSNTVHGTYTTATTGENLTITFSGCVSSNSECHSAGQANGVIKTFDLDFHNILIDHAGTTPGILITPSTSNNEFARYVCGGIITVHWKGNGVIGDVTRECGETVDTGEDVTLDFESDPNTEGVQKYMQVTETGTKYDLSVSTTFFGTTTRTASLDGEVDSRFGTDTLTTC
jgi:hypothetical protein